MLTIDMTAPSESTIDLPGKACVRAHFGSLRPPMRTFDPARLRDYLARAEL